MTGRSVEWVTGNLDLKKKILDGESLLYNNEGAEMPEEGAKYATMNRRIDTRGGERAYKLPEKTLGGVTLVHGVNLFINNHVIIRWGLFLAKSPRFSLANQYNRSD